MRIIGGKFKGKALVAPSNGSIRPTSDRLRESLFNTLAHSYGDIVAESRILDMFAGTGSFGLEAISRGANHCLFVDTSAEARALIRTNVENLGLTGHTRIFRRDATLLGDAGNMKPFHLAFADPPYGKELGESALAAAGLGGWLTSGALCILEEDSRTEIKIPDGFVLIDSRKTGNSQTVFMRFG